MFSYSKGYYVSPPDDQYLKFKNRCSLSRTCTAQVSLWSRHLQEQHLLLFSIQVQVQLKPQVQHRQERSGTNVLDSEHEEWRWKKCGQFFCVIEAKKTRRKTNLFVPKLSKERRQTKVIVPQRSKERRKTNEFVPQLSKGQRKTNLIVSKLSKEHRQIKVFVPQPSKEQKLMHSSFNYQRDEEKTNLIVPNYGRNKNKPMYLFLNYRKNEENQKYSFLNYWWFDIATCNKTTDIEIKHAFSVKPVLVFYNNFLLFAVKLNFRAKLRCNCCIQHWF